MDQADPSAEQLFLRYLDQIESLLMIVARRYALHGDEPEEFGAWVKLKLVEDDYAVLRKFRGEAKLRTYLTTVFVRLMKDWLIARRGKWRPSAQAQRAGVSGVRLESLISYDGRTIDEAIEVVKQNFSARESREELRRVAEELPQHPPRSQVSLEALSEPTGDQAADRGVVESEREAQAHVVSKALSEALADQDPEDRLLLQMHYGRGMTVASIARLLDEPQRPLYSRLTRLHKALRVGLQSRGVDLSSVQQLFGWAEGELDVDYGLDDRIGDAAVKPDGPSVPIAGRRGVRRRHRWTSDSRLNSNSRAPSPPEIDLGQEAQRLESLAALLDGVAEPGRRAEMLAALDGDDLDLLSEVEALADEIASVSFDDVEGSASDAASEGATVAAPAVASDDATGRPADNVVRGPWGRRTWMVATTLAAALALAVVAPRLLLPSAPSPQLVAAALDVAALSGESRPGLPWSPQRGPGGGAVIDGALSSRNSFRLGVLATDFQMAARSDAAAPSGRETLRASLSSWFREVTGDSLLAVEYSSLAELPPEEALARHESIQEGVLHWVDPFYYRYGVWVRGAWLAAESGELRFFRGSAARSLGVLEPPSEELAEEVRRLRQTIRGLRTEADLPGLAEELAAIADRHAR